MPKFLCECGETLSFSEIPCKIEYKFISDVDYDLFQGDINAEDLYDKMKSFIECQNCKRLWMFWNGYQEKPQQYILVNKSK